MKSTSNDGENDDDNDDDTPMSKNTSTNPNTTNDENDDGDEEFDDDDSTDDTITLPLNKSPVAPSSNTSSSISTADLVPDSRTAAHLQKV